MNAYYIMSSLGFCFIMAHFSYRNLTVTVYFKICGHDKLDYCPPFHSLAVLDLFVYLHLAFCLFFHISYLQAQFDNFCSKTSRDVPIIGSVIRSAADVAISTISVIGRNALRTDIATNSLHGKYEYQQSNGKPFCSLQTNRKSFYTISLK